jgi:hypothetical protein
VPKTNDEANDNRNANKTNEVTYGTKEKRLRKEGIRRTLSVATRRQRTKNIEREFLGKNRNTVNQPVRTTEHRRLGRNRRRRYKLSIRLRGWRRSGSG